MFKKIDYISPIIQLTYGESPRHRSLYGGIFSLIVGLFAFSASIYFALDLFLRINPKAYLTIKFVDDAGFLNITYGGLFHCLGFDSSNGPVTYDKRLFTVYSEIRNGRSGSYKWEYDICDYDADFDDSAKEIFFMMNQTTVKRNLCIRRYVNSTTNETIQNKSITEASTFFYPNLRYGSGSNSYFGNSYVIHVSKCINSTSNNNNCYSQQEIDSAASSLSFSFFFIDNYVDVTNYTDPIGKFRNRIQGDAKEGQILKTSINFQKQWITTHDGLLFDNVSINETYIFDTSVEKTETSTSSDPDIIRIEVLLQNMGQFYERTYVRIQDIAANVGGTLKLLMTIATIVNYILAKYQLYVDTVENIEKNKVLTETKSLLNDDNSKFNVNNNNVSHNIPLKIMKNDNINNNKKDIIQQAHVYKLKPKDSNEKKIELKNNDYLGFNKSFCNFVKYLVCCKKDNKIDKVNKLRNVLLSEEFLLKNHLEILKIRKKILEKEKYNIFGDPIHIDDILNYDDDIIL